MNLERIVDSQAYRTVRVGMHRAKKNIKDPRFWTETVHDSLVESGAQVTVALPVFSMLETGLLGYSTDDAQGALLGATLMTYFLFGKLYGSYRDHVLEKNGITEYTPEQREDQAAYISRTERNAQMRFNIFRGAVKYIGFTSANALETLGGIGIGMAYGKIFGRLTGKTIDFYRSLTDKNAPIRYAKYAFMGVCMAASTITTAAITEYVPDIRQDVIEYVQEKW